MNIPKLIKDRNTPVVKQSLRRFFRSREAEGARGVAAVEFAVVAPFLAFMMISVVDLGRGIYRKMQVQNAAQAGAEYAIAHGFNANSIASAVTNATHFSGVSASPTPTQFCGCATNMGVAFIACSLTCAGGSTPGTYVTVSAQGAYTPLLSYPGIPQSLNFTAQATARLQ